MEEIVLKNKELNDFKSFEFEIISSFSMTSPIDETEFKEGDENENINLYIRLYSNITIIRLQLMHNLHKVIKQAMKGQIINLNA